MTERTIALLNLVGCILLVSGCAYAPQPPIEYPPVAHKLPHAEDVVVLDKGVMPTRNAPPRYPREALIDCLAGVVYLELVIDTLGNPESIQVVHSSPAGLFDRSAVSSVRNWQFEVTMQDGEPAKACLLLALEFAAPDGCY